MESTPKDLREKRFCGGSREEKGHETGESNCLKNTKKTWESRAMTKNDVPKSWRTGAWVSKPEKERKLDLAGHWKW